ncbi:MAG: hypothetical protein ACFCUN_01985 [Hyphomicrobiaceae bacterium]
MMISAVLRALIAFRDAVINTECDWPVEDINRWIRMLPDAESGRWRHLEIEADDLSGFLPEHRIVANLDALIAFLEHLDETAPSDGASEANSSAEHDMEADGEDDDDEGDEADEADEGDLDGGECEDDVLMITDETGQRRRHLFGWRR